MSGAEERILGPCIAFESVKDDTFYLLVQEGSFQSVKKTVAIKENYIFRRLYNKGKSAVSPYLAIYVRRNGHNGNRLGLTVSTKVGKAVIRNKMRRRLREIYRTNEEKLVSGIDMVIVSRIKAKYATYQQLEQSFLHLCAKLDLLER